jgi:uncharacterized protein (TIGR00369 family)
MEKNSFFWKAQREGVPACSAAKTLGSNFIKIDPDAGTVQLEFMGKNEFTNPVGNVQGGFLAAMLDETMGPALAATLSEGEFAPAIDLNIQFINPASVGKIEAFGRIDKKGKEVCYLSGELRQNGKVVAKSTAAAIIRKIKTG